MNIILIIIIVIIVIIIIIITVGCAFRLEDDPMAKCLDGSAPGESRGWWLAVSSLSV
jgi:heme/copper-type cytochrome/quinol oxidase subunit 2